MTCQCQSSSNNESCRLLLSHNHYIHCRGCWGTTDDCVTPSPASFSVLHCTLVSGNVNPQTCPLFDVTFQFQLLTFSSACVVFFLLSLYPARWSLHGRMIERHDHMQPSAAAQPVEIFVLHGSWLVGSCCAPPILLHGVCLRCPKPCESISFPWLFLPPWSNPFFII